MHWYAIALIGGGIMALAGLLENWKSPADEWVRSFTTITTLPKAMRQNPQSYAVILPPERWPLWLGEDAGEPEQLKAVTRVGRSVSASSERPLMDQAQKPRDLTS